MQALQPANAFSCRSARNRRWRVGGGLLLSACLLVSRLGAQTPTLEPLVVTGPRTAQLPGNVLLMDAASLDAVPPMQRDSYLDLLSTAAGAYAGNPSVGTFSLRGLNQDALFRSAGTASNPLITVMEDGAPLSTATLRYLPPLRLGLDSVTLRRGPQFLQAGPNSLGGTLELRSTPAGFAHDGRALLEAAEHSTYRAGISQDFTLRPDELALRFTVDHRESDGEVTNIIDGNEEFAATERNRYQARIAWRPAKSRDTQVDLTLVHDESRGNPFGRARAISGYDLLDRRTALNTDPDFPAQRDAAILSATFDLAHALELKSTTALQCLAVDQHIDLDETAVLSWVADGDIDELRFTQDLSLGRDEGALEWVAGGYFEAGGYDMHYTGVGISPLPNGSPFSSLGEENVRVLALYGRGDWEFAKNLHLYGGLRVQHEQRDLLAKATIEPDPENRSSAKWDDSELLPQIGLSWRPQEQESLTLQLSRGYRGGGVSYAPTLGTTTPYDAESSWDLELNGQAQPLESLTLSASIFHSWMEDQQVTLNSPRGLPSIDTYITNAGKSRRYGSELEARWQACVPLAFSASLGWVHSEFDTLDIGGVDRSGEAFPNAPEWTSSVGASYHHASGIFSKMLFSWADSTYTDPASPQMTALESRRLLSAQFGYAWEHARVYVFGSNLLDEDYAVARFDNSASRLPISGLVAPSRCIGIGCEFEW